MSGMARVIHPRFGEGNSNKRFLKSQEFWQPNCYYFLNHWGRSTRAIRDEIE